MRKIDYPLNTNKLRRDYLAIYDDNFFIEKQREWESIRAQNTVLKNHFPFSIRRIMVADFEKLVRYYRYYLKIAVDDRVSNNDTLKSIFNYKTYQPKISSFFMDANNGFNITTCHYCDMSYINTFVVDFEKEGLEFINNENSIDRIKKKFVIKSNKNAQRVIDGRPYDIAKFNALSVWKMPDKFHSVFPEGKSYNHFDLDHVLDKATCPVIGLSLMNFVPSCQVCNEKLKRNRVLGTEGMPIGFLSPTSHNYKFDESVSIEVLPKPGATWADPWEHPNDYILKFDSHETRYEQVVDVFKLDERYGFHKAEALYWLKMKKKYPDSHIQMMARVFDDAKYTPEIIKEDIFRIEEEKTYHRCFSKMKREMLK